MRISCSMAVLACASSASLACGAVSRDINSYVLFAYNQMIFKGGSNATNTGHIRGGNIGVNYAAQSGFALAFGTSGNAIMDDGYQAVADSVTADSTGSFYDLYANSVNNNFGATVRHAGPSSYAGPIISPGSLPVLPFTPNRSLTNSASAVTLSSAGGPHNLAAGAYQDVRFNDNTVVNLGAGVYDMRNLSMGKHVTINVLDTTILQIDRQFDPNDFLMFGTNADHHGGAHVFVGGFGDNVSTTRSTNFSHNAVIHMQYFSPTAWLDLGGGNELYGHYWADRITGDPNNNVTLEVPTPPVLGFLAGAGLIASRRRRN